MSRLVYALEAAPNHFFPRHPECPERATAIEAALERLGVFQECAQGQVTHLRELPQELPGGLLAAVHSAQHVAALQATSARVEGPTAVRDPDDPDGPTFATPSSFADAMMAACAAVALVDAVCVSPAAAAGGSNPGSSAADGGSSKGGSSSAGGKLDGCAAGTSGSSKQALAAVGMSICRPPGHHATAGDQMGFCLLNNAALAARHAQRAHGLAKILILDWDVHHGNGTQDIFAADPSVLFVDLHQEGVWPGSGGEGEVGEGAGQGSTINVPLPWHSGHQAAQQVFDRLVAPAARRFGPDLIIVSAGYDAHWQDPLEHLQFQSGTFHWLAGAVHRLAAELCGGRLLLLLEGGYNQEALGESVAETLLALLGKASAHTLQAASALPQPEPLEEVEAMIGRVGRRHGLTS